MTPKIQTNLAVALRLIIEWTRIIKGLQCRSSNPRRVTKLTMNDMRGGRDEK